MSMGDMKSQNWLIVSTAHHLHMRCLILGDLPVIVHALLHGVALLLLLNELVLLLVVQLDIVLLEIVPSHCSLICTR